jgi:AraC-like DNA-binding protein
MADETYLYDQDHFLITLIDLPTVGRVLEASPERPLLALLLKLDPRAIAQLMIDTDLPPLEASTAGRAVALSPVSLPLVSAVQRLVDLLDEPRDLPILGPLIQREILYRLLISEQGGRLRQIGSVGSQGHQIARAIDWLKAHYAEPLRVEDLATRVGMSASAFYHHFRALTAMSPVQYQKQLRLHEARRLMLVDQVDSGNAGLRVGYESASQFSREYSRLFGAPPLRDIFNLRRVEALEGAE